MEYLHLDPAEVPIEVSTGIHFFMGGIWVDNRHQTNFAHLYAAGECACIYHGANRLGGNSLLGAVWGGQVAAKSAMEDGNVMPSAFSAQADVAPASPLFNARLTDALLAGLSIVRNEQVLSSALAKVRTLPTDNPTEKARACLAEGMLRAAMERKESRGAHTREDYPDTSDEYRRITLIDYDDAQDVRVHFAPIDADNGGTLA